MSEKRYWLWIFSDIQGLRWVIDHEVMAFAEYAEIRLRKMSPGDQAILFVTRGAFHNPTRDRSRLAGIVTVRRSPRKSAAVQVAG